MENSLLGINTYSSSFTLNSDLINKLKTAELNSINSSINNNISKTTNSLELTNQFKSKINDLFNISKTEISNFSATSSNDNIQFDAPNENLLKAGTYSFNVISLAKKDVYASDLFNNSSELFGDTSFTVKGTNINTTGKTVDEVISELNLIQGVNASFESVSATQSKLVIKSSISGTDNSLDINSSLLSKIQTAENLKINIDGIEHQYNENSFSYDGLSINVMKIGETNLSLKEDNTSAKEKFDNIISKYNDLVSFTNNSIIYNNSFSDSKSTFKDTLKELKDVFFDSSLFQEGAELDKNGLISIKNDIPIDKINSFINNMNNKLTDTISVNSNLNNFISYEENLIKKNNELLEKNSVNLEKKYNTLSQQFASYNSLISSFESSFASLKQMILYQTNGN